MKHHLYNLNVFSVSPKYSFPSLLSPPISLLSPIFHSQISQKHSPVCYHHFIIFHSTHFIRSPMSSILIIHSDHFKIIILPNLISTLLLLLPSGSCHCALGFPFLPSALSFLWKLMILFLSDFTHVHAIVTIYIFLSQDTL